MVESINLSVLIVDRSMVWGADLRSQLMELSAQVHVVSAIPPALTFARAKKIDAAIVEYGVDAWTCDLCRSLAALKVPCIFTTADCWSAGPDPARGLVRVVAHRVALDRIRLARSPVA